MTIGKRFDPAFAILCERMSGQFERSAMAAAISLGIQPTG